MKSLDAKPSPISRVRRSKARRGFTLLETLIASSILTMIGIAFMTLYVNIISVTSRTSANAVVAMDAAKAVDRLSLTLREARRFEFMDNGTTGPLAYRTATSLGNNPNYSATVGTGSTATSIVTGIHIVQPASMASVSLSIPSSSGFNSTAMAGSNSLVDYRTDGAYLDVYRSDRQGHPAPTTGSCLWMRGTVNGGTVPTDSQADTANGIDGKPLVDNISNWAGAVQFIQGQTNEVRIKVVTGRTLRGTQQVTSESSAGDVSSLAAADVYLRNHDPNGVTANSTHGKSQYAGQ